MGVSSTPSALTNVPRDSSRATQNDNTYRIYASTAGKAPGEDTKILSPGTTTDTVVASLNKDQVIVLSAVPNPIASLSDSDDTKKWFQKLDSDAAGSLTLDNTKDQNVKSFLFTFKSPWPLTFSSASDVLILTFGASSFIGEGPGGARIDPPGIDAEGEMLTCGLDFVQTQEINAEIKDLFTYAGVAGMLSYLPEEMPDLAVTLKRPQLTDPPQRNALWFVPSSDMQTTIRLQFQVPAFTVLSDLLGTALKGFTIKSTDIICKKKTVLGTTEEGDKPINQGEVAFSIECSVQAGTPGAPAVSMVAGVEFFPSGINLTFMFLSEKPLSGILKWLSWLVGDDTLESFVNDILNKEENNTKLLPEFTLRRMTVGLDTLKDPKKPKLSSFAFDIEVSANFGRKSNSDSVVFLISYNWNSFSGGFGTLAGQLWNDFDPSKNLDLQPYEEIWTILQPVTKSPAKSIEIASLIPTQKVVNIPDTLPSEITRAYVELAQDSFAIGGTVTAKPVSPGSAPQPYLGEVVVDASFSWGKSSAFTLDVSISAGIEPSEGSSVTLPALLTGSLSYDSSKGAWDLKASLSGLHASTLAEFFDDDAKDHVRPLIESIVIDTLSVEYKYEKVEGANKDTSKGSEFTIKGDLLIASLKLGLDFRYDKTGFKFSAALNPEKKDATIGDVLSAILGSTDDIELPDFVSNMKLVGDKEDAFRLDVEKKETTVDKGDKTASFQFLAQLNIGDLHLAFAQLHSTDWGATAPSKRLVKAAINGFPHMEVNIPLVGDLEQPLDELYFLWVQDPPQKEQKPPPGKQAGLTRKDITLLNSGLQDPILVKDKIKPKEQKPTDLLVAAGCHFAVIIHSTTGERSCLLDYDFMKPKDPATKALAAAAGKKPTKGEEEDGGPSAQAPYKKKAGPLSISNVGLKYKGKKLAIMFDATFEMGPIGFSLLGFSLEAEFETLDKLPKIRPNVEGMAAAFEKPPLTIAGIIRHGNDGGLDYYAGGLIIGWVPYQFEAAGFYGMVTPSDPSKTPFRSIFVFAKLDGPLITLEFAEITGICGGFGYNSNVRVPTADDIYQFPFIASTDIGGTDNALQALQKLTDPGPAGWFQPLDKTYWAAVGLKVDAFQMLSVDAVLVVQFGDSIKLGIFALALADIPTAKSPVKFAHVELGISAVVDFDYGTLKIEAQLSPRSFIFSQDCHLTGGAALYYWFDAPHGDRSKIGSFVFTLGGYHEAYDVPVGYPNPPRLGISWSLGSSLSISGQAYFAITPKACMGGGRLHASFSAGPIEAWFDAFADFLINYKPFHFNAQGGLAVGIRFNIDILFIHTHISVEIGAQLYLWGPPLAGRVHVDFWIVAFNIDFGESEGKANPVSLYEFYQLVLQASSGQASASVGKALLTGVEEVEEESLILAADPSPPKNEGHNFLAQSGLSNPGDKPERQQNADWVVRAGTFSFVVACKMAINAVKNDPDKDPIITYGDPASGIDVFSKPMQLRSPMKSTLVVQVQQDGVRHPDEGWRYEKHLKSVPRGLWAKYDPATDPSGGKNNIKDLLNSKEGSLPLMMGVQITAPKAQIAPDPFPAFVVADADLQRLRAERPFPTISDADAAWAPGKPFTGDEVEKQFEAVYNDWVDPAWGTGEDGQKGFVGILADSLKWDAAGSLKDIAGIPDRLKKGFMQLYVAAPLLTK